MPCLRTVNPAFYSLIPSPHSLHVHTFTHYSHYSGVGLSIEGVDYATLTHENGSSPPLDLDLPWNFNVTISGLNILWMWLLLSELFLHRTGERDRKERQGALSGTIGSGISSTTMNQPLFKSCHTGLTFTFNNKLTIQQQFSNKYFTCLNLS